MTFELTSDIPFFHLFALFSFLVPEPFVFKKPVSTERSLMRFVKVRGDVGRLL